MDFVLRLVLTLVFLVPTAFTNSAYASSTYEAQITSWGGQPTPEAACAGYYPAGATTQLVSTDQAKCTQIAWPYGVQYANARRTCQAGDSISGSNVISGTNYAIGPATCTTNRTCTAPQVMGTNGVCTAPPCTAGTPRSYSNSAATGSDQCLNGCVVALDGGNCGTNALGVQKCFYDGHETGSSCSTNNAGSGSTNNDPAYDCAKQGQTWGTVNGQTVCLKPGTGGTPPTKTVTAGKTTTSKAADGTETVTQEPPKVTTMTPPSSGSADGTPPKISEETTNPDGSSTKTEESADKFCESHPDNIQCKNLEKSEYSGICNPDGSVVINCKGDAIQCDIAQKQAEMNCKVFQPDEGLTNAYNEAKNDTGSNNLSLPQNASVINLPTDLDASSPYAGQCNEDLTVHVGTSTVTIPFSAWCGILEALGYLFLACSYITAAIILGSAL